MARIFIDGFESGGDDLWDAESNATVISSAGLDMDGDYCLDLNAMTEYLSKDITADDEMYVAFLWRPTSATNSEALIGFFKGGAALITLSRAGAAAISVRNSLGTALATGTKTFTINTTYLIEVRIKIADSGGRAEVKVDGVQDIDFTGDTKSTAETQFDKITIGHCGAAGYYCTAYFDNFVMDDAAWIGDTKIQKRLLTGAGATTGWTPSAGANYQCVDERPASDVDYNSINAINITDTFVAGSIAGDVESIKCFQVQSRTESDGAPTPTNLKLAVRSSGTDYLSGDKAVPSSPKSLHNLWETDPATASAWIESGVNAAEIGYKSAA